MNNKILLGIIAVIVLAGGYFLFANSPKNVPVNQTTTQTPTSQALEKELIEVTASGFSPSTIKVRVGTNVVWINKSGADANVSSVDHPAHRTYPALNLGNFQDGSSVQLRFDTIGTYNYHNHLNPEQIGTVIVE